MQSRAAAPRFFLLLFFLLLIWVSLLPWHSLPAIIPASAPASQFSAARAMTDLAFIAAEPRPSGSPRALAVRDYLVDAIRGLGMTPEVQDVAMNEYVDESALVNHVMVHNVMVRLPGRDPSQAVLVSGHYDSVPTSTGASDCGGCVATTLELLRVLRAGPPLEHDVIFLFTDAEELEVYGAQAFVDKHPWAKDVRLSIVYEGLGTRGPSVLYATSPQSGWVIEQAVGQLVHPLVSSFINDLMWKLAGNSGSDLDAFAKLGAGVALLTFGDQSAYHSLEDNVANLDPGNLQAHGDNGAALVRYFANLDLAQAASQPDRVFFNLLPGVAIQYSQTWALVLGWLAALAFIAVLAWAMRSRQVKIGGSLLGVAALPVGLLACLLLVTLAWWLIRLTNGNLHAYLMGVTYQSAAFLLAFLGLGLAIFAGLYSLIHKWANQYELALGAMFWWALLAVLAPYGMPGLSYLFSWPLLFALLGMVWLLRYPGGSVWLPALCLALSAVAGLLLIPPVIYQFNTFAGRMESLAGIPLAALPLFFLVLLLGLLWPQLAFISPRRWPLALAGLAIFVVCVTYASLNSGFGATQPKPNTVVYWLDADTGSASWITVDDSRLGRGTSAQLDPWTSQFFPNGATTTEFSPWLIWIPQAYPALTGSAPVVELPHPAVNVVQDEVDAGLRRLGLVLTWPNGAYDGLWTIQSSGPIAAVAVDGAAIATETGFGDALTLAIANPPGDEIGLEILAAPGPVTLTAQLRWLGLPANQDHALQARPDWMMPAPFNPTADSTFLYKTFRKE